jgi:hypothetical protein
VWKHLIECGADADVVVGETSQISEVNSFLCLSVKSPQCYKFGCISLKEGCCLDIFENQVIL